ncbi:TonB-dependent receptor [Pseudochelatococcus contaminans]|uniref:Iron complex outermembrane receptor protein n=1 Tax=Pseudochelatococcus contaminans TaxID=1538103 RepID=A0A7W6EHV2_9HYPH|nr:TonB-dependent receptor [Pseudochelatococcus contaminans]MBB3810471.1 iron complex outermembrane receptor protein [Pseudochelatococcus contaminans]
MMIKRRRSILRAATALMTGIVAVDAGMAQAQEAAPAESVEQSLVLDAITVTARRREEKIQNAPVSVTVIPGSDLGKGRVDTMEDAAFRAPNVLFNGQGGPLSIRGVTSLGIAGGVDRQPAVGMFLDDVYLARPLGYPVILEDLERVEIVRGSQSTLYGKNTIGGAVNLLSREPGERTGGEISASLGTHLDSRIKAAFETPITGTDLAVRGVAAWSGNQGYIRNLPTQSRVSDTDVFFGRFVAAGAVGDNTRIKIIGDYTRDRGDGGLWYAPLPLASNKWADHDFKPENRVDSGGVSLRLDHDFSAARLTSITAFRSYHMKSFLDGDFTPTPYIVQGQKDTQRQFSQELRLSSPEGQEHFRWNTGVFYMRERFEGTQYFDLAAVPRDLMSRDAFKQTADTISVFGEASYFLTPKLEITAGARYTYDHKSTTSEISTPSGTYMFGMPGRVRDTVSFSNVSPEASLTYHFSDGNIVYGKISRGYKSGGISPYIEDDGSANRYDPELTTSYEVGAKATSSDGRFTLAASLFYIDWKDQQAVIYTTPFTRVYRNAAAATSKGFEVEATAELVRGVSLRAGYGYTDAAYDDFIDTVMDMDYTGNPLPFAPRHSATAGLLFRHEMANGLLLKAGLDYAFRSSYSFTSDNSYRQSATHLLDAHVGFEKDDWKATLWAKNLTDEHYLKNYFNYSGTPMGVAAPGRTVGVTVAREW